MKLLKKNRIIFENLNRYISRILKTISLMKIILTSLLLLISSGLFAQSWQSHFSDTKALAKKENKNILLVFSGSDWCAPCIKLDTNIWKSDIFKKEAAHWSLYKADYPRKKANKLSDELTKENNELAEKYNKSGTFPLVLLITPDGKVLGTMGFENISATDYINKLKALEKK